MQVINGLVPPTSVHVRLRATTQDATIPDGLTPPRLSACFFFGLLLLFGFVINLFVHYFFCSDAVLWTKMATWRRRAFTCSSVLACHCFKSGVADIDAETQQDNSQIVNGLLGRPT